MKRVTDNIEFSKSLGMRMGSVALCHIQRMTKSGTNLHTELYATLTAGTSVLHTYPSISGQLCITHTNSIQAKQHLTCVTDASFPTNWLYSTDVLLYSKINSSPSVSNINLILTRNSFKIDMRIRVLFLAKLVYN